MSVKFKLHSTEVALWDMLYMQALQVLLNRFHPSHEIAIREAVIVANKAIEERRFTLVILEDTQ